MEKVSSSHMVLLDYVMEFLIEQADVHRRNIQYWSIQMSIEGLERSHRREHLDRIDAASIRLQEVKELIQLLDFRFSQPETTNHEDA